MAKNRSKPPPASLQEQESRNHRTDHTLEVSCGAPRLPAIAKVVSLPRLLPIASFFLHAHVASETTPSAPLPLNTGSVHVYLRASRTQLPTSPHTLSPLRLAHNSRHG